MIYMFTAFPTTYGEGRIWVPNDQNLYQLLDHYAKHSLILNQNFQNQYVKHALI